MVFNIAHTDFVVLSDIVFDLEQNHTYLFS